MARPHVLYLAWGFPPHRGPGTYRPLASVNELARRARVTVLTVGTDTFDLVVGGDRSLMTAVDPAVRVVRVPMRHESRDPMLGAWPAARAANPRAWTRARAAEAAAAFPEPVYLPWWRRAVAGALAVHDTDPVDLLIASGNPYVDFGVAAQVAAEAGLRLVLDDRDSWLLDVYTGEPRSDAQEVLPWFEAALDVAEEMWFVNPAIAGWHAERFPGHRDRFRVVENGWDPRVVDLAALGGLRAGRRPGGVVTFVGTVNPGLPIAELAAAWRAVHRDGLGSAFRVIGQLGHTAAGNAELHAVVAAAAGDGVEFAGRVPAREVLSVYAATDVLVFAKEGTGMVTSGKVYEYAATGLPIVLVAEREHDARRVLAGYPRLYDAHGDDPAAIAAAMTAALADAARPGAEERRVAAARAGLGRRRDAVLGEAFDALGLPVVTG